MPGATLTSRNHGAPSASTTRSVRDRSRSPSARCAVHGGLRAARGDGLAAAGPGRRTRWRPRCSARRSRRSRRRGRSRRRAGRRGRRRCRRRRRRPRCPSRRLDQRRVAVREAAHHRGRAGRSRAVPRVHPSAEPPLAGLTISGSPSAVDERGHHRGGAELAEGRRAAAPRRRAWRCRRAATAAFADGLSNAARHGRGRGPDVGQCRAARARRARAPSSPVSPCSSGTTTAGRSAARARRSRSASTSRTSTSTRRRAAPRRPAGPSARHVALVRETAGEDDAPGAVEVVLTAESPVRARRAVGPS